MRHPTPRAHQASSRASSLRPRSVRVRFRAQVIVGVDPEQRLYEGSETKSGLELDHPSGQAVGGAAEAGGVGYICGGGGGSERGEVKDVKGVKHIGPQLNARAFSYESGFR
jgi:hypothetical protein